MTIQKLPGGLTETTTLDNAGEPNGLTYSGQTTTTNDDGSTTVDPNGAWLGWTLENDSSGRLVHEFTPVGAAFTGPADSGDPNDPGDADPYDRADTYDHAGRLAAVRDRTTDPGTNTSTAACQTRSYTFDANDNRTTRAAINDPSGACATSGTGITSASATRAFDTADRPTTGANGSGTYVYDPLGRTTTLPASDTPKATSGDVTVSYYNNDLPKSLTQAGSTIDYSLDAADRRSVETHTPTGGTSQLTRHYTDTSDNPSWVSDATGWQRYAELIGSDLGLTVDQSGTGDLTLANPHGDVVTTIDIGVGSAPATSITGWNNYDEFGNPAGDNSVTTGRLAFGWLGAKQRALTDIGLTLMGVRLYNPVTALFTSTDPVEGGNANSYSYPSDPINSFDLDGQKRCGFVCKAKRKVADAGKWTWKHRVAIAGAVAFGACVLATAGACAVASAVAVGFSFASNYSRWRSHKMSTGDFAASTAIDVLAGRFKAVRFMGKYKPRHYRGAKIRRWWRHNYSFRSTKRAFQRHPWRSAGRVGRQAYGAYRSVSGRNYPDF